MKPRGRRRVDHGRAAIAHLRNELKLSWREIARRLNTSARTVRRMHQGPKQDRRGRPCADLDTAVVTPLRDSGMSLAFHCAKTHYASLYGASGVSNHGKAYRN